MTSTSYRVPTRRLVSTVGAGLVALALSAAALAQAPPGYYDTVDTSNSAALRASLHDVIDDHTRFPYTSTATDTWDVLELADEDPNDAGRILDVYRNASYAKEGGGNSFYNREHSWPKSYGFPNDGSTNYPYTDCHHLFLCDDGYNSSRSNKPYRTCDAGCGENPTDFNDGRGGGSGAYPGNSNWTSGSLTQGTWETWGGRRGDVARALLYLDVRYEGDTHGVTGVSEPDLVLTDDEFLIGSSNTGSNESVGYMGMLAVLLQWHAEDPVDALELARNDAVFSFQGNRNPFIDHPEWVDCLFGGTCGGGDTTPPAPPTGLAAAGGDGFVDLFWSANGEPDLAGYEVYRGTSAGGPYVQVNGATVLATSYSDGSVANGTTYFYVITAVDLSANESGFSAEVAVTPQGGGGGTPPADPWINELHYDNASTDTGEFVEVAGAAGLDLSGWSVVGYNGNGGRTYKTVNLSGILPDQGGCIGVLSFAFSSMQNGAPDGLALVDPGGAVIEFLSYEGAFTATNGPASGLTSVDIGVSESSSTPAGHSLQLGGAGNGPASFTWQAAQADTPGAPNAGQTFQDGCGGGDAPPAAPVNLAANAGDSRVDLTWDANVEPDLDGYLVYRATSSGGPFGALTPAPIAGTAYADLSAMNGTTYHYVVSAVDLAGQESAVSNEASGTPADLTPPAPPAGLVGVGGDGFADLDWLDNGEPDLAGYLVQRATTAGGPYTTLNGVPQAASNFTDGTVTNGTTYFYVVVARDLAGNDSGPSAEVAVTPVDATPPAAPQGLGAVAGDGVVDLSWSASGEGDLDGYHVYRSETSGGPYAALTGSPQAGTSFSDGTVSNGTTYHYVVTAVDTSGNESAASAEASATPQGPPPPAALPWINEFHYDNSGRDKGEFVEIAGPAGLDLSGWRVLGYNGSNGDVYRTVNLSGTIPDQGAGLGTLAFTKKWQNGAPDGLALVDPSDVVVLFISYEGTMTGDSGPAAGLTSTNIGVSESSSTPQGWSLQLGGGGSEYPDFTWQSPLVDTPGSPNDGQSFLAP